MARHTNTFFLEILDPDRWRILILDPDPSQNVLDCPLVLFVHPVEVLCKFVNYCVSNPADRQTEKQTNKHDQNITLGRYNNK